MSTRVPPFPYIFVPYFVPRARGARFGGARFARHARFARYRAHGPFGPMGGGALRAPCARSALSGSWVIRAQASWNVCVCKPYQFSSVQLFNDIQAKVASSSAVGSGSKSSNRLAMGGSWVQNTRLERPLAFAKPYQFSSVQLFKDMQAKDTTNSALGKRQQIFEPSGAGRPVSPEIPHPSSPGTTSQRVRDFARFLEPSGAFWPRDALERPLAFANPISSVQFSCSRICKRGLQLAARLGSGSKFSNRLALGGP